MSMKKSHHLIQHLTNLIWVLLGCFAWLQSGVPTLVDQLIEVADDCDKGCPGDDEEGNCPPGCDDCICCPVAHPMTLPALPVCPPLLTTPTLATEPALPPGVLTSTLLSRIWRPPQSLAA